MSPFWGGVLVGVVAAFVLSFLAVFALCCAAQRPRPSREALQRRQMQTDADRLSRAARNTKRRKQ